MTENPYFEAVQATTQEEADRWFSALIQEARVNHPYRDYDAVCEDVVSSLMYVAGYYGPRTRQLAGQLYSHKSPYRR